MATTEHTINDALAGILRETRRAWQESEIIRSENTGMLKDTNERPDILVIEPNVSPVVIETEVMPAATVELEAAARLGKQVRTTGKKILSSIAVRLPLRLRTKQGAALLTELANANDLEMALYTGNDPSNCTRWPDSGWIIGSVSDLSILVQSASLPPDIIDEATEQMVTGISEAAGLLEEMAYTNPGAIHKISEEMRQEDATQTRRMATTILANALVFHETLAGGPGELANVNSLDQIRGSHDGLNKTAILDEWRKILIVNYWPIFDIARRILEVIPAAESKALLEGLAETADRLLQNHLMRSHDLTGAVFQRLIADRKFLAAYYTTPASAALLVGLAIGSDTPPAGGSWSSAEDVKALRIADFACGTGTLLSTIYQRLGQLHEIAGGDAEAVHPDMMAKSLVGCDVLPAAAHLTASMLAGAHPTVKYEKSSILTVAYGKQDDGGFALGSLDLLDPQGKLDIISISTKALEGTGEAQRNAWLSLPHASFDLVIMNPPFTRPTGHEGKKVGVHNPMFAAFSLSADEQREMGESIRRLTKRTGAGGNAGEASIFLLLADRMLKVDGTIALVMPLSLMLGDSWESSRALLAQNYSNLVLISIAGAGSKDMSFSADTGMGECLVVGRKSKTDNMRATFVVLRKRPQYPLQGAGISNQIHRLIKDTNIRRIEDGPVGGTTIYFGNEDIGEAMDSPISVSGGWNLSRIADLSLAQTAYQLVKEKRIWLAGMNESETMGVPISTVGEIGKIGPLHLDIEYDASAGGIRGPFDISVIKPSKVPTYPVLWSHDAKRERTLAFEADAEGIPHMGMTTKEKAIVDTKVTAVWSSASYCHFNRDFQFNSQSTAMQFTSRKTIGGRAWLSISMSSKEHEKALVLWANTSLGLLLHWWHANKQQSGRGNVGKAALHTLAILDISALTPGQLSEAVKLFDDMSQKSLLPVNEIDRDMVRKELDDRFMRNVLGLAEPVLVAGGPLEILRMKLSQEPSIRGGK